MRFCNGTQRQTGENGRIAQNDFPDGEAGKQEEPVVCVWSVLRHHNLLTNYSHEAFARQMMSSYWFGDIEGYKRFSGDTLREYKRYFSDYDYMQWDNDAFLEQKQLFGMTKWSNSLCQKFQSLCQKMEQAIVGWSYL